MKKPRWHYCHTWQMNFYFFMGWRYEDYKKYVKKHFSWDVQDYREQTGQFNWPDLMGGRICLWVKDKDAPAVAAHEALHAVNRLLNSRGYGVDPLNDEAQTYLLTELMQAMGYK